MAIRVALISANQHKEPYPVYPLGTAYLKAYVESHINDCKVVVWDMNLLSNVELETCIQSFKPDIVCLSLRNVDGANSLDRRGFMDEYKALMRSIRTAIGISNPTNFLSLVDNRDKHNLQIPHSKKIPVIIGGAGFSIYPEIFMRELAADYGIQGEGEFIIVELIKAICSGEEVLQHPRLYVNRGKKVSNCLESKFINHSYIESPCAVYEPHLVEYYWKQSGMLNIQTKRGCPYNCIYCTYPQIDGCKVRTVQVESIVETIAKAKKDFGANYWFFTDSVFNLKKQFNMELAEALIKRDLNISWGAYFSPSNLTDEEMFLYKKAGLTHIEFGTESFCDETLQAYGKHFCFDHVVNCSELALKHNVFYAHFLILAGLGETKEQLYTTIENSKQLKHTVIFPYVGMRIYPNTRLQGHAIREGVISREDELIDPTYYLAQGFDLEETRELALKTGKAWVFPDAPQDELVNTLKLKRNKKGPLWEYLRKP